MSPATHEMSLLIGRCVGEVPEQGFGYSSEQRFGSAVNESTFVVIQVEWRSHLKV